MNNFRLIIIFCIFFLYDFFLLELLNADDEDCIHAKIRFFFHLKDQSIIYVIRLNFFFSASMINELHSSNVFNECDEIYHELCPKHESIYLK